MEIVNKINRRGVLSVLPRLSVKDIERVLQLASDHYFNKGVPLISDEVYDILYDYLKGINPKSDIFTKFGATPKEKSRLPYAVASLDKISTKDGIVAWTDKYPGPYVISDKLDGVSCILLSKNNILTLYTRGDGRYGKNISHLLKYLSIPPLPDRTVCLRGELIISKEKFKKYKDTYSNPRNFVAGIVNAKYPSESAKDIDLVVYDLIEPRYKPSEYLKILSWWKFNVVPYTIVKKFDIESLERMLEYRKGKSDYEIDGLVVTQDSLHPRNTTRNPKYSFAFKGHSVTAIVKVIEVLWKANKDGYLIPRVRFEKTNVSGVELEYATGFNARFIKENKIGPGARIMVARSGDVIPQIIGVVEPTYPSFPNVKYSWDRNLVNIVVSSKSKDVIVQRLVRFVKAIGIKHMSEGIISYLVDHGYDDIFKILSMKRSDLRILGETTSKKLYEIMHYAKKNINILNLMVASNIFGRGFGKKKLQTILSAYPNIVKDYKKRNKEKWLKRLIEIKGLNKATAERFLSALPEFQKFYNKIKTLL